MTNQEAASPRVFTKDEFGRLFHLSRTTVNRVLSHGLVRVIYFGDRPFIPAAECARLEREGLPDIPPGYARLTAGPTTRGRPRKKRALKKKKPS